MLQHSDIYTPMQRQMYTDNQIDDFGFAVWGTTTNIPTHYYCYYYTPDLHQLAAAGQQPTTTIIA